MLLTDVVTRELLIVVNSANIYHFYCHRGVLKCVGDKPRMAGKNFTLKTSKPIGLKLSVINLDLS